MLIVYLLFPVQCPRELHRLICYQTPSIESVLKLQLRIIEVLLLFNNINQIFLFCFVCVYYCLNLTEAPAVPNVLHKNS